MSLCGGDSSGGVGSLEDMIIAHIKCTCNEQLQQCLAWPKVASDLSWQVGSLPRISWMQKENGRCRSVM